jgi:hypothetical protein
MFIVKFIGKIYCICVNEASFVGRAQEHGPPYDIKTRRPCGGKQGPSVVLLSKAVQPHHSSVILKKTLGSRGFKFTSPAGTAGQRVNLIPNTSAHSQEKLSLSKCHSDHTLRYSSRRFIQRSKCASTISDDTGHCRNVRSSSFCANSRACSTMWLSVSKSAKRNIA